MTLPTGTVTFAFTDIEGSTRLLQELGDAYADVTRDHRRIVRDAFGARGGTEIDKQGDAFFFSFPRAREAVAAAVEAQRALRAHAWPHGAEVRVRMGLHTGEPQMSEEGYLGLDVVRAARISAAGHGGQILISETTRALVGNEVPAGAVVRDLGEAKLKDLRHERIYEVSLDEGASRFPPLRTDRPKTAEESLAERIQARVDREIEEAFAKEPARETTLRSAAGLAVLALTILTFVALGIAVVLLLRLLL